MEKLKINKNVFNNDVDSLKQSSEGAPLIQAFS